MSPGAIYAVLAFAWWGLVPLYFRIVTTVPPGEVLAHRILWCLLFLALVLTGRRQWRWLLPALKQRRVVAAFAASATLIGVNWMLYIWSVTNGHVIDASLGYFMTPLVNVLLGVTLLHERLRRAQWLALSIAGAGVVWLTWQAGHLPWIALALAATFGSYGLMRKVAPLGPLEGLAMETLLLSPLAAAALAFWAHRGLAHFPASDLRTNLWLMAFGPITAVPLLLFAIGARSMSMTALGLLQYIGPSIQLGVGLWGFDEAFPPTQAIGFGLIWIALGVYSAESWLVGRRASVEPPSEAGSPEPKARANLGPAQAATVSGTELRIR